MGANETQAHYRETDHAKAFYVSMRLFLVTGHPAERDRDVAAAVLRELSSPRPEQATPQEFALATPQTAAG